MDEQRQRALSSWVKLLTPDVLRGNLVACSLYLIAYEFLRISVVDRTREFYLLPTTDESQGKQFRDLYKKEVLDLYRKDVFRASSLWLQGNGVLTQGDLEEIQGIRDHRNMIAHELMKFVGDIDHNVNGRYLQNIRMLTTKIERWWIREVDMSSDARSDAQEIADDQIESGMAIVMDMIIGIALSDRTKSGEAH